MALVVVERADCSGHDRFIRSHEGETPAVHQVAVVEISSKLKFWFSGRHPLWVDLSPQPFQFVSVGKTMDSALKDLTLLHSD